MIARAPGPVSASVGSSSCSWTPPRCSRWTPCSTGSTSREMRGDRHRRARRPERLRVAAAGQRDAPAQRRDARYGRPRAERRSGGAGGEGRPGAQIARRGRGARLRARRAHRRAMSALLAIDDDEAWQRNVVRRQARRRGERTASDVPGVVFLQIDGLAHEVLRRPCATATSPRWRAGCARARTASSAGRPTGRPRPARVRPAAARRQRRHAGLPLVEKRRGAAIVTNHPGDAESRVSAGTGAACCTPAAQAGRTSCRATRRTPCSP